MKRNFLLICLALFTCPLPAAYARDRIKLETTIIKGNKEMPQIVYIVPWKDMRDHTRKEQTLVLHSLFGDLFEPVHAKETLNSTSPAASLHNKM